MIDFSKLKSLILPEGNVTQIKDASGNVLWSAVKMATITLFSLTNYWDGSISYVVHNGTKYTSPTTFKAAIGDTINIVAGVNTRYGGTIRLNNKNVATGTPATYDYTVVTNATFDMYGETSEGWVAITET